EGGEDVEDAHVVLNVEVVRVHGRAVLIAGRAREPRRVVVNVRVLRVGAADGELRVEVVREIRAVSLRAVEDLVYGGVCVHVAGADLPLFAARHARGRVGENLLDLV